MHIFVKKMFNWYKMIFFINIEEEKNLKHFAEKSFSVIEGAPFKPFEHTMTYIRKMFFLIFFSILMKRAFYTNSRFFKKSMHKILKEITF